MPDASFLVLGQSFRNKMDLRKVKIGGHAVKALGSKNIGKVPIAMYVSSCT